MVFGLSTELTIGLGIGLVVFFIIMILVLTRQKSTISQPREKDIGYASFGVITVLVILMVLSYVANFFGLKAPQGFGGFIMLIMLVTGLAVVYKIVSKPKETTQLDVVMVVIIVVLTLSATIAVPFIAPSAFENSILQARGALEGIGQSILSVGM